MTIECMMDFRFIVTLLVLLFALLVGPPRVRGLQS